MNKKELKKFRDQLELERKKIISDLNHIEKDTLNKSQRDASGDLSGYSFHMADVATDNYDRELNLDIASTQQQLLNHIDDAIRRIDEGTYGQCEICEGKISVERLRVMPQARLCIKCKEEEEKKAKKGS
ncbi:MAG: TraR/DksA C4-type zinc finger protein [Candidatus Omnitrophica bacterium]|nr:TraR/DksA C4-type zinc finger protein [Candidatus Omnitrophota bacterium]